MPLVYQAPPPELMALSDEIAAKVGKRINDRVKALKNQKLQMKLVAPPMPGFSFDLDRNVDFSPVELEAELKHQEAIVKLTLSLDIYLETAMKVGWGWSDGARDIVDTGELKDSGGAFATRDGIAVIYNSPYAGITHYGGYIYPYGNRSIEKVYIPGRPWIAMAFGLATGPLPPFPFEELYARYTTE